MNGPTNDTKPNKGRNRPMIMNDEFWDLDVRKIKIEV